MTNRFKGLGLVDEVPEELWMQVHKEAVNKTIPKKKKAKWLSEEVLQIDEEKERSAKQGRKGMIYAAECRVPENSKETQEGLLQ